MNKREFTRIFLAHSGNETCDGLVEVHMKIWWMTPYSPIGFRLTTVGDKFLSKRLKLDSCTFTIKANFEQTLNSMRQMNRYLTGPYYIIQAADDMKIKVYGEQDSFMLSMMGGDLQQYLDNFERK